MSKVTVSIIMGIYNCEHTLGEALESIISQSYTDWELILCNDGSTDNTYEIASHYAKRHPENIILLENSCNKGLNHTLNRCIDRAKGKYIARMDGDDLSHRDRLKKQVEFINENKQFQMVGTLTEHFDDNGIWGSCYLDEEVTYKSFLKNSPFIHASMLMEKSILQEVGGYSVSDKLLRVEDYHLWVKLYAKGYKGYNIQEKLYMFRDDQNAYNRRKYKYRINEFRVRWLLAREFPLGLKAYIVAFRPLIVGALPAWLYDVLHRKNIQSSINTVGNNGIDI